MKNNKHKRLAVLAGLLAGALASAAMLIFTDHVYRFSKTELPEIVSTIENGGTPEMGAGIGAEPEGGFISNGDGGTDYGPIDQPNGPNKKSPIEGEVFLATVTAYTGVESCSNPPHCTMASGRDAYIGAVACPRSVKIGTRIEIRNPNVKDGSSLGIFTCEDRTARRYDGRYDVFFGREESDYRRAKDFGINQFLITFVPFTPGTHGTE